MKKLLYLDDSLMAQQLMARFVSELCDVVPCASIAAGRQALDDQPIHLIITDYLFPEGDPLEFIAEVRQRFSPIELPIVVTSGSMDRRLECQAARLGVNACLRKPLSRQTVRELVEGLLSHPEDFPPSTELNDASPQILTWVRRGRFFAFSPDLGRQVEGGSAEEAAENMRRLLHHALADPSLNKELGLALRCTLHTEHISR